MTDQELIQQLRDQKDALSFAASLALGAVAVMEEEFKDGAPLPHGLKYIREHLEYGLKYQSDPETRKPTEKEKPQEKGKNDG